MPQHPGYYLVKSEPSVYAFAQLCRDGQTRWDGVRNFEARNNLRLMRVGDLLLYYHSNEGKEVVGVAQVVTAAYPDPTAPDEDWSAVNVAPVRALSQPVTLAAIKSEPKLAEMALVRKSRISVVPVTAAEFTLVLQMGGTTLKDTAAAPQKSAAAKKSASPQKSAAAKKSASPNKSAAPQKPAARSKPAAPDKRATAQKNSSRSVKRKAAAIAP